MKNIVRLIVILVAFTLPGWAQFTTVTGTVIDPNGIPYSGGTITAKLVLSGTTPTLNGGSFSMTGSAGLNTAGAFTMRLADSTVMSPNANWSFTVCSAVGTVNPAIGTGSQCFTPAPITISGSSQSISTQLQAAALALTNPVTVTGAAFASSLRLSNSPAPAAPSPLVSPLLTPAGRNTQGWLFNDNTSKWEDFIGLNNNTLTGTTSNLDSIQLAIFRPVVLNNTGTQAAIKNATLSINTNFGVTTANGAANQESGLAIHVDDVSSGSAADEEAGGEYAEDYVTNNTNGCTPALTETCKYGIRAILLDQRTSGTIAAAGMGMTAVSGVAFGAATQATPISGGAGYSGLYGVYQNNDPSNLSGTTGQGVAGAFASFGGPINGTGYDFHAFAPLNGNRFTGSGAFNVGVIVESFASNANPGNDFSGFSNGSSGVNGNGEWWFAGPLYVGGFATSGSGIPVNGSLAVTGSVSTAALATPAVPNINVQGAAGASVWDYVLTAVDSNGRETVGSAAGQTNTGNLTLTGVNFNQICVTLANDGPGIDLGVTKWNVYRTAVPGGGTPNTLGLIGSITPTTQQGGVATSFCLNDTALAGNGAVTPGVNTTGGASHGGAESSANTQAQTGGNYTNATAVLSTFQSFVVAAGEKLSFVCDVMWQGSSVATTLQVGFSGPASPTAFNADVDIKTSAADVGTNAAVTSLAGTVSGAVAAVANTSYPVHIFGTLENGINQGTLSVQFAAPVATTTVTAVRGSVCYRTP